MAGSAVALLEEAANQQAVEIAGLRQRAEAAEEASRGLRAELLGERTGGELVADRNRALEAELAAYTTSEQESVEQLQRILGFPKPEELRKWRAVLDEVEALKEKERDLEGLGLSLGARPGESPMLAWLRAKAEAQKEIAGLESKLRLAGEKNAPAAAPSDHMVRAFERGAKAERARVLEQSRVELLSWPNGTPERRALESLRKALQDERLPLPAYTTGGA